MIHRKFLIGFLLMIFFVAVPHSEGLQAADQKVFKKRIAVFSFDDKTDHRWHWWTGQPVGEGMADMLVTSLVKTGKYVVIERQEMEQLLKEQALGMSGVVTPESAAQVGKVLGVELAVFGAVTEFGYSESDVGGALKSRGLGLGVKTTKATVAVDVRLVNTSTAEIVQAENVRKEEAKKGISIDTQKFDFDNRDKFDESIVGKATRQAIDAIVGMIENAAPKIPWQAKVIKGDGPVFINAGSQAGINVDDEFVVYRPGEALIDPDTGLNLGATETLIGKIRVVNNNIGNGKASQCMAVSGSGFERNDIVRIQ